MRRSTCLYCENEGVTTQLVQTTRGGLCPIHSADLLAALDANARHTLGLPDPALLPNRPGLPAPRPM